MIALMILTAYAQYSAFTVIHETSYCENKGQEGELFIPDVIVLGTVDSVLACAQKTMANTDCGGEFVSNEKQCACIRTGKTCDPENSQKGFSVYQLSDSNVVAGVKCEADEEEDCKTPCQWLNGQCKQIQLQYVSPMGQMGMTGQMGMAGMGQMAFRQNMECEREFDEQTGLQSVIDLQPAMSPQQCQQQVMQQVATRVCGGTYVFGSHGECSCVRANMICDEDSRPGFSIYQLNSQYQAGMHGGYPATGMQAGVHGYQAGSMQAGMYQGGMYQAGMRTAGVYQAGMAMGGFQGGYAPHHLSASAPCQTLDETTCDSADNCKWTDSGCEIYTEKAESPVADSRWVLMYVIIPSFISLAIGSLLIVVYKSCSGHKTNMNEPILMDIAQSGRTIV